MGEKSMRVNKVTAVLGATLLSAVLAVGSAGPATSAVRTAHKVPLPPTARFTISSFNLLGSSHTPVGGKRAVGTTRMVWAKTLLDRHHVDVAGFQEMQSDQYLRFMQLTAATDPVTHAPLTDPETGLPVPTWGVYPGLSLRKRDSENSIAWRLDKFDLVQSTTFTIPYFDGNPRPMPLVLLRDKASGMLFYVANVHNPADTKQYRHQQKWRTLAKQVEASLQNQLSSTGIPRLFTGDMNERATFFCSMVSTAPVKAARGGTYRKGVCDAKKPRAVDWVVGSHKATFSGYYEDRSPLVAKTTDHPVISTDVTFDSTRFPAALGPEPLPFSTLASYLR
jgi:hypothetical protein